MDGSGADGVDGVLTNNVERRENTVTLLLTKNIEEDLPGGVDSTSLGALLLLDLGLSADASDTEEELSDELDGRLLQDNDKDNG